MRPACSRCKINPRSINYIKDGKTYYRKTCNRCTKNAINARRLYWERTGYKKKPVCERCGFRAKNLIQLDVFHVDGSLLNNKINNLKTICANCQRLFGVTEKQWRIGDLVPDF